MTGAITFRRETLPPLATLAEEWRGLEAISCPSFFTSWHWIGTLLEALPEGSRLMLLRGSTAGRTVALALLGARTTHRHGLIRSRGLFINETGDPAFDRIAIEHNGLLTARGCEAAADEALLAWFSEIEAEADEFYLSGSLRRWPHSAIEDRGLLRRETVLPSYSVDLTLLAQSNGELYPALSANARQQLRRSFRDFERYGPIAITEAGTAAEALAFFAEMKTLHCASWERRGRRHAFAVPFFEQFHRLLLTRCAASGAVQLLKITAGDRTLGYLYNFRLGDRVYAYQSGFADQDRRERPGHIAHALAIGHAYRSGARIYDFMAGANRLKESFARRRETMVWQTAQQPRLSFRAERMLRPLRNLTGLGAGP